MTKVLMYVFGFVGTIGSLGNILLFLLIEWSYISKSFLNFINPLVHVAVIIELLGTPFFWVLLVVTIIGFAVAHKLQNLQEFESPNKDLV